MSEVSETQNYGKGKTKPKPKRVLKNISFEQSGAHLAVVGPAVGGPASGADYALVVKGGFTEEVLQKMQQVKVTMELPEFLQRFFGMYYDDAEVLAALMGYEEPEDDGEEYDWKEEHKKYIEQRLSAFEVMKSLYEAENPTDVLKNLNAEKYLALLQDQEKLETVFKKAEKDSPDVAKAAEDDKPQIASEVKDKEVSTSVVNKSSKETKMTDKTQEVAAAEQVEMVEKAKVVDLQKALEAQQVELQKALETIKQFEAEKKAAIEKARLDQMKAAVKDEARAEVLFKAAKDASDADFEAVIKALSEMQVAVEKSDLFVEKGASAEDTKKDETESPVAKLLKAKYAATAKK